MTWRFRKSLKIGPIRLNLSKSGIGTSIGVRGFRVGTDAKGRSYTAASIPGTGIYERKYSSQGQTGGANPSPLSSAAAQQNSGAGFGLGILLLAFVAGGLVVFMLMPKPIPPPVTPPAAVSAPQAPPPHVPVKRRRGHRSIDAAKRANASHIPNGAESPALPATLRPTSDVPAPAN